MKNPVLVSNSYERSDEEKVEMFQKIMILIIIIMYFVILTVMKKRRKKKKTFLGEKLMMSLK